MIDLSDSDWEKLRYRVDKIPFTQKCVDKYPELKNQFLEFLNFSTDTLSSDMLIRFIVLCYDRTSPYVQKMENIMERKVAIFNYLKIEEIKGSFPADVQGIIKSADSKVAKIVYQFCKFQDSLTYFALVTTVETYIQMNESLGESMSSARDSKDTADVLVKLDKIEDRIDKLSNKLFKHDTMMKDFIGSVLVVEGRKHKIIPEDVAE